VPWPCLKTARDGPDLAASGIGGGRGGGSGGGAIGIPLKVRPHFWRR